MLRDLYLLKHHLKAVKSSTNVISEWQSSLVECYFVLDGLTENIPILKDYNEIYKLCIMAWETLGCSTIVSSTILLI